VIHTWCTDCLRPPIFRSDSREVIPPIFRTDGWNLSAKIAGGGRYGSPDPAIPGRSPSPGAAPIHDPGPLTILGEFSV
jgi:hypothetical protein